MSGTVTRLSRCGALACAIAIVCLGQVSPAAATFPGKNGKLAFTAFDGGPHVTVMNPDGTGRVPLAIGADPAWSSDGSKIAFTTNGFEEIWVMSADGTGRRKLTGGGSINSAPAWSPDGTKIAFFSNRDLQGGIWVVNADGSGGERRLTADLTFGENFAPDWSPDGTKIAFHTTRHGFGEGSIYVMNADGSNETRLTSGADRTPSWSPDGSEILFTNSEGGGSELRVVSVAGNGERGLTDPARPGQGVWSPQGNKAAFSHRPAGAMFPHLFIVDADGGNRTELLTPPEVGSFWDEEPSWQPIPGPSRADYKNAAKFCKAEQEFWGADFAGRYGGGANAFGRCVSGSK